MGTQRCTWRLVSMATRIRRRSCSCSWAEEPIPASATWRTTSRLTCCRAATRESRFASPHTLTLFSPWIKRLNITHLISHVQLKLMLKKRSASSRRRIVSLQDQEWLQTSCNPHLWGMSFKGGSSVKKRKYVYFYKILGVLGLNMLINKLDQLGFSLRLINYAANFKYFLLFSVCKTGTIVVVFFLTLCWLFLGSKAFCDLNPPSVLGSNWGLGSFWPKDDYIYNILL